jgi:lipid II:glycine glycyltransferase (peptidoglycan interpeptide bridge formation enzyme)
MQIRIIGESREWNSALRSLGGTLYQSWEWGELRSTQGWRAWRILASDPDSPRAAVQVLERRLPILGLSILYAPRGIVTRLDDHESVMSVGTWLKNFVRQRRAILLRADPFILDTYQQQRNSHLDAGFINLPHEWSRWNMSRANMNVDISGTEEQILSNMKRSHRYNIHRASRGGLVIRAGCEIDQLREFYSLLLKTSQRQHFAVRSFKYFLEVREKILRPGMGELFLGYNVPLGKAVAGIICAYFSRTCYYLYGGFDWESRQAQANEPLHWQAIKWARDQGCTEYDLAGSGTQNPPQEGNAGFSIYNFKKGFGAELRYLVGYFDLPGNAILYKSFRFAEDHMRGRIFDAAVKARAIFLRAPASAKKSLEARNVGPGAS